MMVHAAEIQTVLDHPDGSRLSRDEYHQPRKSAVAAVPTPDASGN
jgi:hypothetical protein